MENHYSKDQTVTTHKQKWYQWVPNWLQIGFALGGMFVTIGIAYANIQSLDGRMDKVEANQMQQANLMVQVGQIHIQIEQANKTDRNRVVKGKSVSVRVVIGGREILKTKKVKKNYIILIYE